MIRLLIAATLALCIAGCAEHPDLRSVAGSECKVFERPPYVVRGQRPYDQDWIDRQVEGGVGACSWPRPTARPAAIEAAVVARPAPLPKKRRGLVARIKAVVHREPEAPTPAVEAPAPMPEPAPVAKPEEPLPPPPPPRRRTPLELLLDKSGPAVHGTAP